MTYENKKQNNKRTTTQYIIDRYLEYLTNTLNTEYIYISFNWHSAVQSVQSFVLCLCDKAWQAYMDRKGMTNRNVDIRSEFQAWLAGSQFKDRLTV